MPFHIEVKSGLRHARSFNLTDEELQRTVIKPWLSGTPIKLGDRAWRPDESELCVLEGPELSNPELSFGQGWSNASRNSTEVTRAILGAAVEDRKASAGPAAIVIEAESAVQTLTTIVSGQQTRSVGIDEVRQRLDSGDPSVAAVILVVQRDLPS